MTTNYITNQMMLEADKVTAIETLKQGHSNESQIRKKNSYGVRCINYAVSDTDNEAQETEIRERLALMSLDEIIEEVHHKYFEDMVGCKYDELELLKYGNDIHLLPNGYETDCLDRLEGEDLGAFDCCDKRFAWSYIDLSKKTIGLYTESFTLDTTLKDITRNGQYV